LWYNVVVIFYLVIIPGHNKTIIIDKGDVTMDLFEKCYEFTAVKEAIAAGIYPYFHALTSGQDTEVFMEGHRTIMIGSNNYMGLTSDPRVIEEAKKALLKYGTGCSGSRFLNGTLVPCRKIDFQTWDSVSCSFACSHFDCGVAIVSTPSGTSRACSTRPSRRGT
jgi:hypothetical protein